MGGRREGEGMELVIKCATLLHKTGHMHQMREDHLLYVYMYMGYVYIS